MRKVPEELSNPIDNAIIKLIKPLCGPFKAIGFTANGITYISIAFKSGSAIVFAKPDLVYTPEIFVPMTFFIQYFFDCFDGYYARKYNQVTDFGDQLDHFSDVIFYSFMSYMLFQYERCNIILISAISGSFAATLIHVRCQEELYNKKHESKTLNYGNSIRLCSNNPVTNKKFMKITRLLGTATNVVVYTYSLYYLLF